MIKALANQDEAEMTGVPPCKYYKKNYIITKLGIRKAKPRVYPSQNFQPCVYEETRDRNLKSK